MTSAVAGSSQYQRPGEHDDCSDRADDQHLTAVDTMGARGKVPDRRYGDPGVQDEQPSGVDQRGDVRRVRVAVRTGGEPDRQQRDADRPGVRDDGSATQSIV
jgi:hypothetical protein